MPYSAPRYAGTFVEGDGTTLRGRVHVSQHITRRALHWPSTAHLDTGRSSATVYGFGFLLALLGSCQEHGLVVLVISGLLHHILFRLLLIQLHLNQLAICLGVLLADCGKV